LGNTGDHVKLYSDNGTEMDMVAWEGEKGWSLNAGEGEVLVREDEYVDTDTENDWIVSSPDPQVVADGLFPPTRTDSIPLYAGGGSDGWNYVSFSVIPDNSSLLGILENETDGINGSYDKVMYYSGSDDRWRSHMADRPVHFNDVDGWNNSMGIWIRMVSNDTLNVTGTVPLATDITLYPGWNMVSYPSEVERLAGDYLPSEVSKIGLFNSSMEYNLEYISDLGNHTLRSNNGYWIYNSAEYSVGWSVEY